MRNPQNPNAQGSSIPENETPPPPFDKAMEACDVAEQAYDDFKNAYNNAETNAKLNDSLGELRKSLETLSGQIKGLGNEWQESPEYTSDNGLKAQLDAVTEEVPALKGDESDKNLNHREILGAIKPSLQSTDDSVSVLSQIKDRLSILKNQWQSPEEKARLAEEAEQKEIRRLAKRRKRRLLIGAGIVVLAAAGMFANKYMQHQNKIKGAYEYGMQNSPPPPDSVLAAGKVKRLKLEKEFMETYNDPKFHAQRAAKDYNTRSPEKRADNVITSFAQAEDWPSSPEQFFKDFARNFSDGLQSDPSKGYTLTEKMVEESKKAYAEKWKQMSETALRLATGFPDRVADSVENLRQAKLDRMRYLSDSTAEAQTKQRIVNYEIGQGEYYLKSGKTKKTAPDMHADMVRDTMQYDDTAQRRFEAYKNGWEQKELAAEAETFSVLPKAIRVGTTKDTNETALYIGTNKRAQKEFRKNYRDVQITKWINSARATRSNKYQLKK